MSAFRYHLIPIFSDNYIFIIENIETHKCAVVDPGSSAEVIEYMKKHRLKMEAILITHHHWDHIDGVTGVVDFGKSQGIEVAVYAPEKNKKEIPQATRFVKEGDVVSVVGLDLRVLDLPGHTLGHIGYYAKETGWLFSGDVVFGLGCGRLFEGAPAQQFDSLGKIKKLNENTKIFCTHEYTERNLEFCKHVLLPAKSLLNPVLIQNYENQLMQLRRSLKPSVPLNLSEELKCNPFLLAANAEEFAEIRSLRNKF